MAAEPNPCFPPEAKARVVSAARRLRREMPADDISVHGAWLAMRDDSWKAQQRWEHTMALVTSLRQAHNMYPSTVLWPTPAEYGRHCKRQVDPGDQGHRLPGRRNGLETGPRPIQPPLE